MADKTEATTVIPRVIDDLTDLPENLREPLAGAYVPGPDGTPEAGKLILAGTDPNVARLQGALQNERGTSGTRQQKIQELQAQLEQLQAQGSGASEHSGKQSSGGEKTDTGSKMNLAETDEFRKEAARIEKAYKDRLEKLEAMIQEEQKKAVQAVERQQSIELDQTLEQIALDKGASKKTAPIVRRLMRESIKRGEDGDWQVVDAKGNVRLGETENVTKPMSLSEFTSITLSDNRFLLAGNTVGSGAGGGGTDGGARSIVTMTEAEAKDPVRYRAKREEARKAGAELQII